MRSWAHAWGTLLTAPLLVVASASASAGAAPGTRAHPYKKGAAVTIDGFRVRVVSVNRNAWPRLRANASNRPPEAGTTYVTVTLRAKSRLPVASVPFVNGTLNAVGPSKLVHSSVVQSCGVISNDVANADLVSAGATVRQNACWQVSTLDAPSLVMFYDRYDGRRPIYFSLK